MKILLKLVSLLIVIVMLFIASANLGSTINLALFVGFYYIKFIYVILGFLFAGLVAGLAWSWADYLGVNAKLKEYQRKLEKTSVQSSEDSSRVEVLEAKIATLEKALQSALENKE